MCRFGFQDMCTDKNMEGECNCFSFLVGIGVLVGVPDTWKAWETTGKHKKPSGGLTCMCEGKVLLVGILWLCCRCRLFLSDKSWQISTEPLLSSNIIILILALVIKREDRCLSCLTSLLPRKGRVVCWSFRQLLHCRVWWSCISSPPRACNFYHKDFAVHTRHICQGRCSKRLSGKGERFCPEETGGSLCHMVTLSAKMYLRWMLCCNLSSRPHHLRAIWAIWTIFVFLAHLGSLDLSGLRVVPFEAVCSPCCPLLEPPLLWALSFCHSWAISNIF